MKPIEIVAAERLKKQVEDYIKKRIEHLEVMRDQVERVQQIRLEKQVNQVIDRQNKIEAKVKEKKNKAATKLSSLFRGFLVRQKLKQQEDDLNMSMAS